MPIREQKQAIEERIIFDAFLNTYRTFASTVAKINQPAAEFPDVVVDLKSGDQIDFEIAEWLHHDQMQQMIRRERLTEAMLEAIGEQGPNRSQYFDLVLLFPQPDFPRFEQRDTARFRADIWALIEDTERRWPHERFWRTPTGRHENDFSASPTIGKYVSHVNFYPMKIDGVREEQIDCMPWINVSSPGGSYSSDTALSALESILEAKIRAYGRIRRRPWLLVYYGAAAAYNTPWYGFKYRTFCDVAAAAARVVASQSTFENIFLLKALEPELEAYEIFPVFSKCN